MLSMTRKRRNEMTLGKKLSGYRKLSGMTQQQLGDKLNLSPQAISKWENDLAEPDLTTLKTLAELYQVTVDKLLDLNDETFFIETEADEVKESVVEENNTIGY
jgi:transcriptional regulator with XRE-family HTH domain